MREARESGGVASAEKITPGAFHLQREGVRLSELLFLEKASRALLIQQKVGHDLFELLIFIA
ncbi:MAG: hypothetical protein QOD47_1263 [Gemmatimonadaceae bacterium]|jgi:hypothetical protein|nr:hypothetical protein [Gemmatimonadaceae bacterium]